MKYLFDTEDYNSPALLEQDELDSHIKFFKELKAEIIKSETLYKKEMTQE